MQTQGKQLINASVCCTFGKSYSFAILSSANDKPICTPEPVKEFSFSEQDLFVVIVSLRVPKFVAAMTPEGAKAFGADRALFSKASKTVRRCFYCHL